MEGRWDRRRETDICVEMRGLFNRKPKKQTNKEIVEQMGIGNWEIGKIKNEREREIERGEGWNDVMDLRKMSFRERMWELRLFAFWVIHKPTCPLSLSQFSKPSFLNLLKLFCS